MNNRNKRLIFALWLLGFMSIINACKEKNLDSNSCEGYKAPSPDFFVQDELQKQCSNELGIIFDCDTFYKNNDITFTSALDYESYAWDIINDPNFKCTTKSFKLFFEGVAPVKLRLIGKRKPNTLCDPSDDGIDTIVKSLTILPNISSDISSRPENLVYGRYLGFDLSNPNIEVGMEIVYEKRPGFSNYYTYINYFPDSCSDKKFGLGISSTYNLIFLNYHNSQGGGTLSCQSPRGWAMFTPTGVDIQYATWDIANPSSKPIKRRFIGKRIN